MSLLAFYHLSYQFRYVVNNERSNVVNVIKSVAGIIFTKAGLTINPTVFLNTSSKEKNLSVLWLLHRNGEVDTVPGSDEGAYHRIAPILFKDPQRRVPSEFLQNHALVEASITSTINCIITDFLLIQIIRVIIYGKSVLKDALSARGRPKGRGQRLGAKSVTEGLIAAAAVIVCWTSINVLCYTNNSMILFARLGICYLMTKHLSPLARRQVSAMKMTMTITSRCF